MPLHSFEKKLYLALKPYRSSLEDRSHIIAVSGGLDSIVLLHALVVLRTRFKMNLIIAHMNHRVRGKESDRDTAFVQALARKYRLEFSRKTLRKINQTASENFLREKRYDFLFSLKRGKRASYIFTAHHQDDLLETRLMRLLQGTGFHGLQAMSMTDDRGLMRPFLSISRDEILSYARHKGLHWREDATNKDTGKLRNWLRNKWLKFLRQDHPELVDNLKLSLERLVKSAPPHTIPDAVFQRRSSSVRDGKIYSYLRHYSRGRVTHWHVLEFKKLLQSARQEFRFRLAGRDWIVQNGVVRPS